jgi:hypothetical protein
MNARPHPPGFPALALIAVAALVVARPAVAQKIHNTYGSPLDTIMNSHLTTDVPEAKDFVKETSPDPKDLKYTPLTGPETEKDPERPKPRDPKGVAALRAELESAGAVNAQRGKAVQPIHVPRAAKTKPEKTAAKAAKSKRVATTPVR